MSGPGEARADAPVATATAADQARRSGNLVADARRLRELKSKRFPWYVIESLLFENGYQAVVLHRMAHACKRQPCAAAKPC